MMISGLLLLATVVSPKITDEVLQNPDMGLCYYQYSNRFWAYSIKDEPADQPVRVPWIRRGLSPMFDLIRRGLSPMFDFGVVHTSSEPQANLKKS